MKVALASDHAGFPLKRYLARYLSDLGYEVLDLGVNTADTPADYPDSAAVVAHALLDERAERGIVICGSGIGACIAANKFTGIYASIAHDSYSAAQGVEHDRMNVLCLGARIIGDKIAEGIVSAFLSANADPHERFERRFLKVKAIEENQGK